MTRAAIVFQAAAFDGYISLLFDDFLDGRSKEQMTKWEMIDQLCAITEPQIRPPKFQLVVQRNFLCHPAGNDRLPDKMPTPAEVEAEEKRINEFSGKLKSALLHKVAKKRSARKE